MKGCPVWIGENEFGTLTDSMGFYSFIDIPVGEYFIHAQLTGYCEACVAGVVIKEGTPTTIELQLKECCSLGTGCFCPVCGQQDKIIPVVYGKPSNKTLQKANKGKVYLGGCIVTECDPNYYCRRDSTFFNL